MIHAASRLCVREDVRQGAIRERVPTLVVSAVSAWAENRIDAAAAFSTQITSPQSALLFLVKNINNLLLIFSGKPEEKFRGKKSKKRTVRGTELVPLLLLA